MSLVVLGVDPHKQSHTATALAAGSHQQLGSLRIPASPIGYGQLLGWARQFPQRRWAIENARGLGCHLTSGCWFRVRRSRTCVPQCRPTARDVRGAHPPRLLHRRPPVLDLADRQDSRLHRDDGRAAVLGMGGAGWSWSGSRSRLSAAWCSPFRTPALIAFGLGLGITGGAWYMRMQEMKEHGVWTPADANRFYWNLALDLLSAVTMGFGRVAVVAAEAGNLARAATAARMWFALRRVGLATDVVNVGITTIEILDRYHEIANSNMTPAQVDAVPAIIGPRRRPGRPRKRPANLHADKGYDFPGCRRLLRRRGITPRIARRRIDSSTRLGRHRWKVERSLAWLLANRRLTVRYERRGDLLQAFLHLACALICARKLRPL
jgi:hypothetical protein